MKHGTHVFLSIQICPHFFYSGTDIGKVESQLTSTNQGQSATNTYMSFFRKAGVGVWLSKFIYIKTILAGRSIAKPQLQCVLTSSIVRSLQWLERGLGNRKA